MKKLIFASSLFAILFLTQCKKLDKLTQFNLDYKSNASVPPNTVINLPLDLFTPDMTTNYEEQMKNNDTRSDLVEEIKITGIDMVVINPQGGNFDFLKSINVYISAEGLPEKEVAWKTSVPDGLTRLQLDYTGDNLKDYVAKNTIKFRVKTVTDKSVTQTIDIEVNSHFRVNAKVLGV